MSSVRLTVLTRGRLLFCLQVAAIIAAGWWVYAPALHGGFLWDDRADILGNPFLRNWDGLWAIWREPQRLFDFYPLKYSAQWVQWQLWQREPFGYHLTNLGLHVLGALLFWRVLRQLGLRDGWLGALLFTIHPIAVESVAWISELKNTLSLPPLLLAVSAFIDYSASGRRRDHLRALLWYVVNLLCKTSAAMLPFAFLLYLWWKRGRIARRDLVVTAPFFAVSLVLGLVTIWFQHERGIAGESVVIGGFGARCALMITSYGFYLWKCVWPVNLLPIYPLWKIWPPSFLQLAGWVALAGVLYWLWQYRRSWGRPALLGLGWFLLLLFPFVGVTAISYLRFTWVMDHLAYLPLLGLIGLAVAGVEFVGRRVSGSGRAVAFAIVAGVCGTLALAAHHYAGTFRSEEALWTYTFEHNPGAWMAHNNLGVLLHQRGDSAAAVDHFHAALRLYPDYPDAHKNLADHLRGAGDLPGALLHYEAAIRARPTFPEAQAAYAELLRTLGRLPEALAHFAIALQYDPADTTTHNNYGLALRDAGDRPAALDQFEIALRCDPANAEAHSNLGVTLRQAGRTREAIDHYLAALQLQPTSPAILFNLANAQREVGQLAQSIASYAQVIRLSPALAPAHRNLAIALHEAGRDADAHREADEAHRLDPSLPELRF